MRHILLSIILILAPLCQVRGQVRVPGPGGAAAGGSSPSVVACANGHKTSTGLTLTVNYSPTAGNSLVVGYFSGDGTNSVALSGGASMTHDSNVSLLAGQNLGFFSYAGVPAGTTSITLTMGNADIVTLVVCEITGSRTADVMDTVGHRVTTGTAWNAGSITTTNAVDVVLGFAYNTSPNSTTLTMTGYTLPTNSKPCVNFSYCGLLGYQVESSTGAYQPLGTLGNSGDPVGAVAASYK